MSTRSAIARLQGDGFRGVYHHWDGYPSGLGATLWELYHGHFAGDLRAMLAELIDRHPAGWSTINGADFSLEAGFEEDGKYPCTVCGKSDRAHYRQYLKRPSQRDLEEMASGNYIRLGHSYDPTLPARRRPACYCHGDRHEEAQPITQDDDAGMEWAYVFDEAAKTLTVLERTRPDGDRATGFFGTLGVDPESGERADAWAIRAVLPLDGPEPDWRALQGWGDEASS